MGEFAFLEAVPTVLTFGRHKGKDIRDIIDADWNYVHWLMGQPWFQTRHRGLFCQLRRLLGKRLLAEVREENDYFAHRHDPPRIYTASEILRDGLFQARRPKH
jgi:hypothetical protein